MKEKLSALLSKLHFVALSVITLHVLLHYCFELGLSGHLLLGFKAVLCITGLAMFVIYFKPFQWFNVYFSIYPVMVGVLILGSILRGIVGAMAISTVLFFIDPQEVKYEANDVLITVPFQGIMAPCCAYQVKERMYLVLEKDYGIFNTSGQIAFETVNVIKDDAHLEIKYTEQADANEKRIVFVR